MSDFNRLRGRVVCTTCNRINESPTPGRYRCICATRGPLSREIFTARNLNTSFRRFQVRSEKYVTPVRVNIHVGANEFHDVIVAFIERIPLDERRRALNRKRRFTGPFFFFYGHMKFKLG